MTNLFELCPDGTPHILILHEQFKKNTWHAIEECIKCEFKKGTNVSGCQKSKDKKHKYIDDSFMVKGIKFITRKCDNCGQHMERPE